MTDHAGRPKDLAEYLCQIGKLIPDSAGKTSRKETVLGKAGRYYVWNTGTPEHTELKAQKNGHEADRD